jgi:ribosomal protein S18 acetylase RimI-like enzyme
MGEILKLSELNESQVNQAFNVFVEGFYNVFSSISKDKNKLHRIFIYSFDRNMTYAYLQDDEPIGFLGIADHNKRPLKMNKEVFLEEIGGLAGKITYFGVSTAMEKLNVVNPQEVYIDYIATSPNHRSKGIGKQLIAFVRDTLGYKHIELEVFSKNPRAKQFYEREGFKVVKTKLDLMLVIQGMGRRIIMRLDVE